MARRPLGTILAEDEVQIIVRRMTTLVQDEASQPREAIESMVRFAAVAQKCRCEREVRGGTIKGVAGLLKVPQSRLREIEDGRVADVQPDALQRYISLLRLEDWFHRWRRANPRLAARLEHRVTAARSRKLRIE